MKFPKLLVSGIFLFSLTWAGVADVKNTPISVEKPAKEELDKKLLTGVWWMPDKSRNKKKIASQLFKADLKYMTEKAMMVGKWEWVTDKPNTIHISFSGIKWDQEILTLTKDELSFVYKGNTYYMTPDRSKKVK